MNDLLTAATRYSPHLRLLWTVLNAALACCGVTLHEDWSLA